MNTYPNLPRYTLNEYLVLSQNAELKLEWTSGSLIAMAGAKPNHSHLTMRFGSLLDRALESKLCRVLSGDTRIYIPELEMMCFPDVVVMCEEEQMYDAITVLNPTGIIEILSPSTESYDRNTKLPAYLTMPSVKQVLLAYQDEIKIESFPEHKTYYAGDRFTFLDCEIEVNDVYLKVKF